MQSIASTSSACWGHTRLNSLSPYFRSSCVASKWPTTHARKPVKPPCCKANSANEDDDDDAVPGKPLRVERLLANMGYGKRRECQQLVQKQRVVRVNGQRLKVGDKVLPGEVLLDGEPLDPPFPMTIMLNKPWGYVVSSPDDDNIPDPKVYDLLPYRFGRRRPFLSAVGRLDKETSGLLLLTDNGQLVHRINSPKRGIWKVYEAVLTTPMGSKEFEAAAKKFASGTLLLKGDFTPLLPAKLSLGKEGVMRVAICEGRYHQIRRMFMAIGFEVKTLRRLSVGGLSLGELPENNWRYVMAQDIEAIFSGPTTEDVMGEVFASTSSCPANSVPDNTAVSSSGRMGPSHVLPSAATDSTHHDGVIDETDAESSRKSRAEVIEDGVDGEEEDVEESIQEDENADRTVIENPLGTIKKYRDGARWRRRTAALKKIVEMQPL